MLIADIHRKVLKNFTYKTDKKQYDTIEKWVEQPESYDGSQDVIGDCEDFALACRKLLRDLKIPSRLVYCLDETGAGHLVLESKGFILDNRQTRVVTNTFLKRKGYKFLKISGYEAGDPWYNI